MHRILFPALFLVCGNYGLSQTFDANGLLKKLSIDSEDNAKYQDQLLSEYETFAEAGYVFSNLAVASATVAAYVTAMSGVQSIFLLILFLLFPQGKRAKVTRIQWVAVILIVFGVFLIER